MPCGRPLRVLPGSWRAGLGRPVFLSYVNPVVLVKVVRIDGYSPRLGGRLLLVARRSGGLLLRHVGGAVRLVVLALLLALGGELGVVCRDRLDDLLVQLLGLLGMLLKILFGILAALA